MEIRHHYGKNVHILDHPLLLSALARFGHPKAAHPEVVELLKLSYTILATEAFAREIPTKMISAETRMKQFTPRGVYRGPALDASAKVVVAAIARAGIIPSELCFEMLNHVIHPKNVRLDHVTEARLVDEIGRVVGVSLSSSKIGGTIAGRILVVPDPMGATGSTLVKLIEHYEKEFGRPKKIIVLPIICTPEYLRRVTKEVPGAVVYAGRLDRGLSSKKVLASTPGKFWKQERGLNEHQYIVPGAGGVGEVLTNSWV